MAEQKICIGARKADGAFDDNYRVLSAAEVVRAEAILLDLILDLADDERFVGMACDDARSVFRLEEASTTDALGSDESMGFLPLRKRNVGPSEP